MYSKTPDISQRAAHAIAAEAKRRGTSIRKECARLGIDPHTAYQWKIKSAAPSAFMLQILALGGYDVIWILTGAGSAQGGVPDASV